ncbi:MAG TPA: hypothetical protein VFQ65_25055 [Kofleriaceae bacterium]|nr:hypothetical protein [Kofleriaceae bacterium]
MTPRRLALRVLLGSIAISALLGIVGILGDNLGDTAVHVLLTSLLVSGASLLALAHLGAWELPQAQVVARGGVAITAIALVVWIAAVWLEPRSDAFWQIAASFGLFAIASAHACILWLARVPPRANAVRAAALACDVLIVVMSLAAIWAKFDDRAGAQFLAVLCILESGLTIALVAIAAASRSTPVAGDVAEVCFCVHCGKSLWVPAGEVRCRHCDATFFVELRDVKDLPGAVLR